MPRTINYIFVFVVSVVFNLFVILNVNVAVIIFYMLISYMFIAKSTVFTWGSGLLLYRSFMIIIETLIIITIIINFI